MSPYAPTETRIEQALRAEADKALSEAFQGIDSSVLLGIVQGLADPRQMAARTLADRGLGQDGRYIGRQVAWEQVPA